MADKVVESWSNLDSDVLLPERREVHLVGPVDDAKAASVAKALRGLDDGSGKPVTLLIGSVGGDEDGGWVIHDIVQDLNKRCPVKGLVMGRCMSISVLVLQACGDRVASPGARFLLHNGSIEFAGELNALPAIMGEIKTTNLLYAETVAARCGATTKEIQRLCKRESYMDAKEALRVGLIDGILQ